METQKSSPKDEFLLLLKGAIESLYPDYKLEHSRLANTIKYTDTETGDITSSVSFMLAKEFKKRPEEIAANIADGVTKSRLIASIGFTSGYINARINASEYGKVVLKAIREKKGRFGEADLGKGSKVLLESPSVNPNKPWHIGHLRNAVLGDSIANIMEACGYAVEREDYIDDLGLQVAESLWGYMNLGNKPDKKFDLWLGEQYVLVNKKMAEDSAILADVNSLIKKMEEHGTEENLLLREISERCVKAQYQTSFDYGIYHDVLIWESDIVMAKLLSSAISTALEKGAAEKKAEGKYAGCIVVNLEDMKGMAKELENPAEEAKVLIRSNGTATYLAKDLAFHMWKFGIIKHQFNYSEFIGMQPNGKVLYTTSFSGKKMDFGGVNKAVNIIGSEQKYQQLILKSIFIIMGNKEMEDRLVHVSYGRVGLAGGSLSGRSGGWMGERNYTADSLLEEVSRKAKEIVEQSRKVTDKTKRDSISRAIAISAVKFDFLKVAPEKDITFSWESALRFEGDTGPYCMYTYARATRLLEKAGYSAKELSDSDYSRLGTAELALIKSLGMASEMIEKACREYRPSVVTDYLIDLSTAFSKFYESAPVIGSGDQEAIRLEMVAATRQVLANALKLLGITPIERM